MRSFHRWISAAAMALLAWVAVTGVLLACLEITVKYLPPLNNTATATAAFDFDATAALPITDVERQIATSLHAALAAATAAAPDTSYTNVDLQLRLVDGSARALVNLNGDLNQNLIVDANSGVALAPLVTQTQWQITAAATGHTEWQIKFLKMRTRLHVLLERLHRGNIIGISGQVMDILTGLAFIILSVTGIIMYFQMLGRRRKLGRLNLFWK